MVKYEWTGLTMLLALAACGGGSALPPCGVDEDCPAGSHCVTGRGCDFECREDVDCLAQGGRACDDRGRCASPELDGGTLDGGGADAGARSDAGASDDAGGPDGGRIEDAGPDAGGIDDAGSDGGHAGSDGGHAGSDAGSCGDEDGDGYGSVECGGGDCDDADPAVRPGASEICNGADDDCDTDIDDGVDVELFPDADGDGFGASGSASVRGCPGTPNHAPNDRDCDDANGTVHPAATELCDAARVDENCDGSPNAGCCSDSTLNASETDVDCGGPDCSPCGPGRICRVGTDCAPAGPSSVSVCDTTGHCPSCYDAVRNGDETDVDCGGPTCRLLSSACPGCAELCGTGGRCLSDTDCAYGGCGFGDICGACAPRLDPLDDGGGEARQQLLLSEINPGEYIELYNDTDFDVPLSATTYYIESPFLWCPLPSSSVVPARGYATVPWPTCIGPGSVTDSGGEIVLLADNPALSYVVVDYVCWGTAFGGRRAQAEASGKWTGACAPALTGGAIHRLRATDGVDAADYDTSSRPMPQTCTARWGG